jgi:hypothetical protein
MKESTKVISSTIIGTSVLTIALATGAVAVFHSQIEEKIDGFLDRHNRTVSGKDTPVSVRGGSIVARAHAGDGWTPVPHTTDEYMADVLKEDGTPANKGSISISGQGLKDRTYTPSKSWVICIRGRVTGGQFDTDNGNPPSCTNKHGFELCSNIACDYGNQIEPTNHIYLKLLDPNDKFVPPPIDDDPAAQTSGNRHRWAFQNNTPKCDRCDHISDIIPDPVTDPNITKPGKVQIQCKNSACEIKIGDYDN